jgi:hypothetical protein
MISPGSGVPLLADSGPLLWLPKEDPDASREDGHALRARSSSVEVRWWRTDPGDRPSDWSGSVDRTGDAQALPGFRPELATGGGEVNLKMSQVAPSRITELRQITAWQPSTFADGRGLKTLRGSAGPSLYRSQTHTRILIVVPQLRRQSAPSAVPLPHQRHLASVEMPSRMVARPRGVSHPSFRRACQKRDAMQDTGPTAP